MIRNMLSFVWVFTLFIFGEIAVKPLAHGENSDCQDVLSGEITEVVVKSNAPLIHAGNYRSKVRELIQAHPILMTPKFEPVSGTIVKIPGEENVFFVDEVFKEKHEVVFRGLRGVFRYFKWTTDESANTTYLSEFPINEKEWDKKLFQNNPYKEPERTNFSPRGLNEEWAGKLARSQVLGLPLTSNDQTNLGLKNLTLANAMMIKILSDNTALTVTDLEAIQMQVTQGMTFPNDSTGSAIPDLSLLTGVVRGTEPRIITRNGRDYKIDVRELQMKLGNGVAFIPAQEVPSHLQGLLIKINSINHETPLFNIIENYVDFIVIHPFTDGNSRTAGIILDYMLLKAGFPPAPHNRNFTSTRDLIFYTPQEAYESFLVAYHVLQLFEKYKWMSDQETKFY